jgi:RHS repeat-associated protein
VYLFSAPSTYQKIAYVITPGGPRWTFVDNGNGTFTPPPGRHETLVHNGDGSWDLTLQRRLSRLHFDATGALTYAKDDYGNTLNVTYDGAGRVQQIADAAGSGRYLNVGWGANGRISTITDNSGRLIQYGYTGNTLTTVTDAANRVTTYGYTTVRFEPLLTRITENGTSNWNRVITDITYDSAARTASYTEAGETYTYTYADPANPVQTVKTNSTGAQWKFLYDSKGMVTDRTPPPYAGSTHVVYYPDESIQQVTDGVGIETFYTYDPLGGVQTVTRDYQGTQAIRFDYTYDPAFPGRVASITPKDPGTGATNLDWQAWQYEYYQAGTPAPGALFKVKRVENNGSTLDIVGTYVYNSKGQVTRYTSGSGGVTDLVYDAQGNLHTATLPANNDAGTRPVITYGYDSLGRVTSVTDALNHQTTYQYDNVDRVISITLPKPTPSSPLTFVTTYSYDNFDSPSGLVFINVTDPNLLVTRQGYDQFRQLVQTIDAQGGLTSSTYTKGLLTSIIDANSNVTSYGYEPSRRLVQTMFPDTSTETYSYTGDDRLQVKTNRNGPATRSEYDHLKRLSDILDAGSCVAFQTNTYQGQKLTQLVWGSETHLLGYDSSYRLGTVTQGTRGTINYLYTSTTADTIANYSVQSVPSATYTYYPDDSANTIVWSPVSGQFKYRYTLPGQYQSVTFPNGATRNYNYDDQGRLTNLTNLKSGGMNLATYAYGYDHNYTTGLDTMLGQRTSVTASIPAIPWTNKVTTYEYDPLYELKKTTYPSGTPFNGEIHAWTYDAIGNRLTSTVNSTTASYTYQKIGSNPLNWQRLLNDGVNGYTYDNDGNALTMGAVTLGWNQWFDRLQTVSSPASSYTYDYQGRRGSKTVSGTSTMYLYDGLNLIQEKTGSTTTDYLFGPGIDEPLAESVSGTVYNFGVDGLGSVTLTTLASGTAQNTYVYDAWGTTRQQIGANPNPPFGYTARENGEAGTMFYRSRYYQPGVGRFLSEDPLPSLIGRFGREPSWNAYLYGLGVPVNGDDPFGLQRVYINPHPPTINPFPLPVFDPPVTPGPWEPGPTPTYPITPVINPYWNGPKLCVQCSAGGLALCLIQVNNPAAGVGCSACAIGGLMGGGLWGMALNPGCYQCAANVAVRLPDCVVQHCTRSGPTCSGACPAPLVP